MKNNISKQEKIMILKNVVIKTRFKGAMLHGLYNEMIKNPPAGYKITTPHDKEISPLTKFTFQVDSNLYKKFLLGRLRPYAVLAPPRTVAQGIFRAA